LAFSRVFGHHRCGAQEQRDVAAKAMRILKVPIIVTTTSRDSMWDDLSELVAALLRSTSSIGAQ